MQLRNKIWHPGKQTVVKAHTCTTGSCTESLTLGAILQTDSTTLLNILFCSRAYCTRLCGCIPPVRGTQGNYQGRTV